MFSMRGEGLKVIAAFIFFIDYGFGFNLLPFNIFSLSKSTILSLSTHPECMHWRDDDH